MSEADGGQHLRQAGSHLVTCNMRLHCYVVVDEDAQVMNFVEGIAWYTPWSACDCRVLAV